MQKPTPLPHTTVPIELLPPNPHSMTIVGDQGLSDRSQPSWGPLRRGAGRVLAYQELTVGVDRLQASQLQTHTHVAAQEPRWRAL
jgi:hypothetical protein